MTKPTSNTRRESSWLALRRCWAILVRLQRGPASRAELIAAVVATEGREAYGSVTSELLSKRFEADKRRLHEHLGVHVQYDKQARGYVITEHEHPLHDLPDSHLQTLTFLADTFKPDSPYADDVQDLYHTLKSRLPPERQHMLDRARGLLGIDLQQRDSDPIPANIWETVQMAYRQKQQLSFDYIASRHSENIARQHVVEPWDFYFDTERGHYYLRGFCLFNDGPEGAWKPFQYISYRLGRIVPGSAEILPTKLPPHPRRPHRFQAIYELAPAIARFGVSRRPELLNPPQTFQLDNGWVRVEGHTDDIFRLARSLLYYGPNCRVLGGKELLGEICKIVKELANYYQGGYDV